MKHLRVVFAAIIAVSVTLFCADAVLAAENQVAARFMQKAIHYDRALVSPPQASPEQHHMLAVSLAAGETGVTDHAILASAYDKLAAMVTYLVQSDTDFYWNGSGWTATSRSTYTWSGTKLIDQVYEEYDEDLAAWVYTSKSLNTYDGNGRLSTSTSQIWQGGDWVNQFRTTLDYDGSGNMTYLLTETWTAGDWVNSSNSTLTYSGAQVATITSQWWQNNAWANLSKIIYTYSGSLLTLEMRQEPAGPTWADAERHTYTYDGSNRLTMDLGERWGASGPWTNWTKNEYDYEGSTTKEILEVHSDWDSSGAAWNELWSDTSRYSGENLIEVVSYYPQSGSLTRVLYTYDGSGNMIVEIHQTGAGSFWLDQTRTVYVYIIAGVFDDDGLPGTTPADFSIGQNYPNPFNLSTLIPYTLDHDTRVQIAVSNILGQTVKTLVDSYQFAGRHQTAWDGRDQNGHDVASGIYFFRVQAEGVSQTRKMVLLK